MFGNLWTVSVRLGVPALLLCGCATRLSQQARYTGPAPACAAGGGTTATLVRDRGSFAFAPTDGALVIDGTVAPDGTLSGTLALRPAQAVPGQAPAPAAAAKAPQALFVSGTLTGESARLAYAAPGCRAQVTLMRVHPRLL